MIENLLIQHGELLSNIGNSLWISMSLMVSFYMFRLWIQTKDPMVSNFSLGVFLVAIDSACHRTWWILASLLSSADQSYASWGVDYRGILLLPIILIALGYSLHVRTALKYKWGRMWWTRPLIAAFVGVIAGFALTSMI